MPVTSFQKKIAQILAENRTPDSYLAGGAALNFSPQSIRYSNDLNYFNDSEERVKTAFNEDHLLLEKSGYKLSIEINIPGYIRAIVSGKKESTKIEWAHDSAWRFLPPEKKAGIGYTLHPVDLAINKLLALAGRDEPRDYLDIHFIHKDILSLGALCWASCGKDPGFTPFSLLELLKRKGKYREEDFARLNLNIKIDLQKLKTDWLKMLEDAQSLLKGLPSKEIGCLYYDTKLKKVITPELSERGDNIKIHFGTLGGVLPQLLKDK